MAESSLPVLFFAFANDKRVPGRYLRNLTLERNDVEDALKPVKGELCQLEIHPDATLKKVIDVFQERAGRIALFHFGGHAGDNQLLLEGRKGEKAPAYRDGLISFLGRQPGLQVVFLNGCATESLAQKLNEAGVPAVISTYQSVDDAIACQLASRFYAGLGKGRPLEQAWQDAVDEARTRVKEGGSRDTFTRPSVEKQDGFPWKVSYANNATRWSNWNLPEEANHPLFGLSLPGRYFEQLPDAPYLGLKPYAEEHAALFFGRNREIKKLYGLLGGNKPAILFHGKSGVGKSSLLDAGLLPRIKEQFEVEYIRRNPAKGLAGSLEAALQQALARQERLAELAEGSDTTALESKIAQLKEELKVMAGGKDSTRLQNAINRTLEEIGQLEEQLQALSSHYQQWILAEEAKPGEEQGKPLILILDQVEETFTKPMDSLRPEEELRQLAELLADIFLRPAKPPRGKIILGFRKEKFPEIKKVLEDARFDPAECFLEPLGRAGVAEIVSGVAERPGLEQYGLTVADGFPQFVAEQLDGSGSNGGDGSQQGPLAPVLQLLLDKMWKAVAKKKNRFFDIRLYHAVGGHRWLSDFLQDTLKELEQEKPALLHSGLALSLLAEFLSDADAAGHADAQTLEARYAHVLPELHFLLKWLTEKQILAKEEGNIYRLLHDTLAPAVREAYKNSIYPGQQASRILEQVVQSRLEISQEAFQVLVQGEKGRPIMTEAERRYFAAAKEKYLLPAIEKLVARDKLELALEKFRDYAALQQDKELNLEATMLSSAHALLRENSYKGVISYAEETEGNTRIANNLLFLCRRKENKGEQEQVGKRLLELLRKDRLDDAVRLMNEQLSQLSDREAIEEGRALLFRMEAFQKKVNQGLLYKAERKLEWARLYDALFHFAYRLNQQCPYYFDPAVELLFRRSQWARLSAEATRWLENGELEKALEVLLDFTGQQGGLSRLLKEEALVIYNRYLKWRKSERLNLQFPEEALRQEAALRSSLLGLLGEIDWPSQYEELLAQEDNLSRITEIQKLAVGDQLPEALEKLTLLLENKSLELSTEAAVLRARLKEMRRALALGLWAASEEEEESQNIRRAMVKLLDYLKRLSTIVASTLSLEEVLAPQAGSPSFMERIQFHIREDNTAQALLLLKAYTQTVKNEELQRQLVTVSALHHDYEEDFQKGLYQRIENTRAEYKTRALLVQVFFSLKKIETGASEQNRKLLAKNKLEEWIATENLEEILQLLNNQIHTLGPDSQIDLLAFTARYRALEKKWRRGLIDEDERKLEWNKLKFGIREMPELEKKTEEKLQEDGGLEKKSEEHHFDTQEFMELLRLGKEKAAGEMILTLLKTNHLGKAIANLIEAARIKGGDERLDGLFLLMNDYQNFEKKRALELLQRAEAIRRRNQLTAAAIEEFLNLFEEEGQKKPSTLNKRAILSQIKEARQLMMEYKVNEALEKLEQLSRQAFPDYLREAILFQAAFADHNLQLQKGILPERDRTLESNRIITGMIQVLAEMEKAAKTL